MKEKLADMVDRRNKRLMMLFTFNEINVRLVGDPQKPAIIRNEEEVLSCYVKNFDLHFTSKPFSDEIIRTVKLKSSPEIDKFELNEILNLCEHRPVYRLLLTSANLYLIGYNYMNSEDNVGRFPVFAKHKPKVYFDRNYADKVALNLKSDGYDVEVE